MRRFSKRLPNLLKYGEIKYDFKALKENLPYFLNNKKVRGSNVCPEKVIAMWEKYKKDLYDLTMLKKRKNKHAEM